MAKYSWRKLSPDTLETFLNWGISFLCFYLDFEIRFPISASGHFLGQPCTLGDREDEARMLLGVLE